MIVPYISRDTRQQFHDAVEKRVRVFTRDQHDLRLRHAAQNHYTLDRFLAHRGLDISPARALSRTLVELVMPEGTWAIHVTQVRRWRVYWSDHRGVRRFTGAADEGAWSADRHFVAYGLGYYFLQPLIVRQLPTQLLTSITPPHFFIDLFSRLFDHAHLWTEVEQRYGPRGTLSKEEKAQIHAEISAPVRSWIVGLGIPDRVREEVLKRERRPLVERWLEDVI